MENWDFILNLIQTYGYWVIFLGILIECTGFPFPGETVLLIGSIAAAQGHLNIFAVIGLAAVAAIVGDNFGYWIGRKLGRDFLFAKLQKWKIMKAHEIKKAEITFLKYGSSTIFIGRFTPLLRIYAALLAGVFEVPYALFLGLNIAGGLAWASLMGSLGYTLGKNLELLKSVVINIQLAGIIIVCGLVLWVFNKKYLRKYLRRKRLLTSQQFHRSSPLQEAEWEVRQIAESVRLEMSLL